MNYVNTRRILFLSFKTLLDRNSGAALELRTILEEFPKQGDQVAALSFNCYDNGNSYRVDPRIASETTDTANIGRFFHFDDKGIRHYLQIGNGLDTMDITRDDFTRFLENAKGVIADFDPTHVIYFGSNELLPILVSAKKAHAKLILYAGTASYEAERQPLFDIADKVIVPSHFIAELYNVRFGKQCVTIPTALPFALPKIDIEDKVRARRKDFITIINPAADKGGHIAFAIARFMPNLSNRFLAVESRATQSFWQDHKYDTASLPNLWWAPWQPNISDILTHTSILLMPALINEAAGKVISEAMAFGVPTIAFDVGGISQQLDGTGVLIPIPPELSLNPVSKAYDIYPTRKSLLPWVSTIESLVASEEKYRSHSKACATAANRYELSRILGEWSKTMII